MLSAASTSSSAPRPPGRLRASPRLRVPAASALGLAALLALATFLHTRHLGISLWIDEAISAGIAGRPLEEIVSVLRQDGAPPLYYLLLAGWTQVFGAGEASLRVPSVLFALALVTSAVWTGRRLFGDRAGWCAGTLAATSAYLSTYAQEARMYTLVALLALLAAAALLHALPAGGARSALPFAGALTLLLYTHNWALFLALGALVAALVLRAPARWLVLGFGVPAAAFLPWLPTLLFQARHTGAPWSNPPTLGWLAAAGLTIALAVMLGRRERAAGEPPRLAALASLIGVSLAGAWVGAMIEPMWAERYLAIVVGPGLALGGALLGRAGRAGLVAVAALAVLGLVRGAPAAKSNVASVSAGLNRGLVPGDVVFSTQPESVPVLAYYGRRDLRFASPLGQAGDPRIMDWRDALPRLRRADAPAQLRRLVASLPPGGRLALVTPRVAGPRNWRAPWTRLVLESSWEAAVALGADRRLRPVGRRGFADPPAARVSVQAAVYERRAP